MKTSIFKKSNWMVLLTAGIVFVVLAATPVFADYTGHVASFKSEENAIKFVDKLKAKGLAAYYQKENIQGKGEFYRTYIGGYKTLPLAQKALINLKKAGEIDFFKIQKTDGRNAEITAKKTETATKKTEPTQKPENKNKIAAQKSEPVQKLGNKIETPAQKSENKPPIATQKNQPDKKIEIAGQKTEAAQKPEKKVAPSIDTRRYYSGIKGIVLQNGKIIRGEIISIDDNDVLKIRTKKGNILSYSFTGEVKEYITEYEP